MRKLTHRHIEAIAHAKLFLNKAFATNPEPRFKREIEADMDILDEVKQAILHIMYNPTLPYNNKGDNDGPKNG